MACSWAKDTDPAVSSEIAGEGEFWSARWPQPKWRSTLSLGRPLKWRRGVALYRAEPFWMRPRRFTHVDEVPADTQWLLVELEDSRVLMIAPLVKAPFRASLVGRQGQLWATVDSGDPDVTGTEALLAYVAIGSDVFTLAEQGARIVAARLGLPACTVDHAERAEDDWFDYLGWCTWEAFGQRVSASALDIGLGSLEHAGVQPRFVVLDDGWQQTSALPSGEQRLAGFAANAKFPAGLAASIRGAKERRGVRWFFVWHAAHGYWGGLDARGDGVREVLRWYSPEVLRHMPNANCEPWGARVGVPEGPALGVFYDTYHSQLAQSGVDGVKVDNQASIEALSVGDGGRVKGAHALRRTLVESAERHFLGRVLHCMSCSTDLLYAPSPGGVTRSSADYVASVDALGPHLDANALFGIWFGQFVRVDWDMFQSRHPTALAHAAGRALSGGPVYLSDPPAEHDAALLGAVALRDGRVLRALHAGRPTLDGIFADPTRGSGCLKLWTWNRTTAVVGIVHAGPVNGAARRVTFSVSEVPGCDADEYVVYFQRAARLQCVKRDQVLSLTLPAQGAEVLSIAGLANGAAALGLGTHLNGGGAILEQGWAGERYKVRMRGAGDLVGFSTRRIVSVFLDGTAHEFEQRATGELKTTIATDDACVLEWSFAPSQVLPKGVRA